MVCVVCGFAEVVLAVLRQEARRQVIVTARGIPYQKKGIPLGHSLAMRASDARASLSLSLFTTSMQ